MCVCVCVSDSPVKNEDEEDQHKGQKVSEDPHPVIIIWTLKDKEGHCFIQWK